MGCSLSRLPCRSAREERSYVERLNFGIRRKAFKSGGGVRGLRGAHSALLAVGRCLAGWVCTVSQGAQVRAAGWRAARDGGTAHTRPRGTLGHHPIIFVTQLEDEDLHSS